MELLIVRHAIAVEHGDPAFKRDEDRPLTPEGMHKFRLAARGLKEFAPKPVRIVSSPLIRARQTAEILRDAVAPRTKIDLCEDLVPGGDFGRLLAYVQGLRAECAALVGHEPHLSGFTSYLLVGEKCQAGLVYKKGGAALVSFPDSPGPGRGTLEWLIQPGALREIAAT
ncbi:MAG: phosphohistidine phosphatase SixA [Candidatus Eisenbacteria bacterium]|uniref:Phosphohistidine phosphatase SixA n=1 Tax=Eiseniibacteriota bacterium TaxID=2212470 RepID=A0A538TAG5_UNCEI|nr:MAG: phosphohistidine phosphatase SixA [Candidatus Eisenbacteria bacterium]